MKSYSLTRCQDCGHQEIRYSNVRRCRVCRGPIERPEPSDDTELRLLREQHADGLTAYVVAEGVTQPLLGLALEDM